MTFYSDPIHNPFSFEGREDNTSTGALLLHGFAGTPAEVRPLGKALARENIFARGILLPGFGPEIADLDRTTGEDWLAASRTAWLDLQAVYPTTVLIGYSLGASLAVRLAAELGPTRLILLAPFWRFPNPLIQLFLPLIARIKTHVSPFDFGVDLDDPGFQANIKEIAPDIDLSDPAQRERLAKEMRLPTTSLVEVRRMGRSALEAANRISAPTLVVQGVRDGIVSSGHTRRLVENLRRQVDVHLYELPTDHEFPKYSTVHHRLVLDFIHSEANKRSPNGHNHLVVKA